MKTTLTITSKRQVTIPKKIWEQMQLEGVRYLKADVKDGKLELEKVEFDVQLADFWSKTNSAVHGELGDTSVKLAAREARRQKRI